MLDRSIAPVVNPIKQVALQEVKSLRLDNDIMLYYLNIGQQPVMRVEIVFKAGKWFESDPGLSYFAGKMLVEGTENRSAKEISTLFDNLGAFVEVTPGFDRITISIHLLSKHLPSLLPVIADIVSQPGFRQSELEHVKRRKKQQLLVDLEKTSFVAAIEFTSMIFQGHPYGRMMEIRHIDTTQSAPVAMFYQKYLRGNYDIILSGSIGKNDLKLINQFLGQEPMRVPESLVVPEISYHPGNLLKEKSESLQSSIRIGKQYISRNHPDYIGMLVVNEILGGYFGSRLMRNIREDKGYTYGIRSGISCLKNGSIWAISTDSKKEFREQTIDEIRSEIKLLQQELVSSEELETVKNYLLGTFIAGTDTPFALADKFKTIHYSDLGYEYYQQYFQQVQSINSERILELSRKYLALDTMSQVIVG